MQRLLTAAVLGALVLTPASFTSVQAQETDENLIGWPKTLVAENANVTIFQPQVESFEGDRLGARAAVSVAMEGKAPVFGAVWFDCRVSTDFDTRMVTLEEIEVSAAKFPEIKYDQQVQMRKLKTFVSNELAGWDIDLSLDNIIAGLELVEMREEAAVGLKHDPPEFLVRTEPTVLVFIDGDPRMEELGDTGLLRVINTPFFIVQDPSSGQYFLKGGYFWYRSPSVLDSWEVTTDLSGAVAEVAEVIREEEEEQARENPEMVVEPDTTETGEPIAPGIEVRTRPAELIQIHGQPEYATLEGTPLLYVENSEADILMNINSQEHFILAAGRWYSSGTLLDGEWTFVDFDDLPDYFAQIPTDSDMALVRASVPGTEEAKTAVLENYIPQTAEINRSEATVEVVYDGDPQFEQCGDTDVYYAVNSPQSVLRIDGHYYVCDDAVWFDGDEAEGPWEVSTEVPDEVQSIPPEYPVYNVKYVHIYHHTVERVYVGYTRGYTQSFVHHGCLVFGTGWWHRPWWGPMFIPRPVTWGFGVHWNPWTGWGFSWGASWGWMHVGVRWGPSWHMSWWGPSGFRFGFRHGFHRGFHHGFHRGFRAGWHSGARAGFHAGSRAGFRAGVRAGQRTGQRQMRSGNIYRNRNGVGRTGDRDLAGRGGRDGDRIGAGGRDRAGTGVGGRDRAGGGSGIGNREGAGGGTGPGVGNRDRAGGGTGLPGNRAGAGNRQQGPGSSPPNNVFADRNGNVHRNQGGQWQNRQNGSWQQSNNRSMNQSLNRQSQARQQGNQRSQNFRSSGAGGGARAGGAARAGGGARGGGARGGGGRR